MSNRVAVSVRTGSGIIDMKIVDRTLSMRRKEAIEIIQGLIWAVHASAEETDVKNARMRLRVEALYRENESCGTHSF